MSLEIAMSAAASQLLAIWEEISVHFTLSISLLVLFCFCWFKACSVCSDHCRAVWCKIGGCQWQWETWASPGGETALAVICSRQCTRQLRRIPPASSGHQLPDAALSPPHTWWTTSARPGLTGALGNVGLSCKRIKRGIGSWFCWLKRMPMWVSFSKYF